MKKYLLGLLVCVFGFIGFSDSFLINLDGGYFDLSVSEGFYQIIPVNGSTMTFNNVEYSAIQYSSSSFYNGIKSDGNKVGFNSSQRMSLSAGNYTVYCAGYPCVVGVRFSDPVNVLSGVCPTCEVCSEQYTSMECQTEYSLMPISSCDSEFCEMNNLCSSNTSGDVTGDGNWSALYINNIQFPGVPMIDINIPDYITWDYTGTDSGFNLYVGSGYDVDYINSIIDINSYRPNSEDFTNIFVSGLTLVFPYIIFVLFLVFMRKLIKRIFK